MLLAYLGGHLCQKRSAHKFHDSVDSVGNLGVAAGWSLRIVVQQLPGRYVWHTPRPPVHRQPKCHTGNELPAKRGNYFLLDVASESPFFSSDYSEMDCAETYNRFDT